MFHGGAEYVRAVLKAVLDVRGNETLVGLIRRDLTEPAGVRTWLGKDATILSFSCETEISEHLKTIQPDVFFSGLPYSYASVQLPPSTRAVYTIHGLREIECPTDRYQYWFNTKWKSALKAWLQNWNPGNVRRKETAKILGLLRSLRPQDTLLVVSEHTKWAVENLYPQRVFPLRIAYSPVKVTQRHSSKSANPQRYFLMVSANRWIKNPIRGILAFDGLIERFGDRYPELTLKVTGKIPARIFRHIKHPERVTVLGYVEEMELERLYSEAWALLYPTLNEGFGYPPLEAMKYGTPVLSSAVCSLTEVCGDAALFFDPRDLREMQDRMLAILDPEVHDDVSRRSRARQAEVQVKQEHDLQWLVNHLLGRAPA
jgi:glycosyltransferase involved in cell wall biosynthesis